MPWRDLKVVFPLVWRDIAYEWILSLCMVFAFTAVFSPLLILLGMKNGITAKMLAQFQRDPRSCLVTPSSAFDQTLDDGFAATLRQKAGVVIFSPVAAFTLYPPELPNGVYVIPTLAADPLMLENGIVIDDKEKQAVLSASLAKLLKKNTGDTLVLPLDRLKLNRENEHEQASITTRVAGIMPDEAIPELKIWLPDWLFAGISYWQKGGAFPEAGLAARVGGIEPKYDGILALSTKMPSWEKYREMAADSSFGFSQLPQEAHDIGQRPPAGQTAMLWRPANKNDRVRDGDLDALRARHKEMGYAIVTLPWLDQAMASLRGKDETKDFQITVFSEQARPEQAQSERTPPEQERRANPPPSSWVAWLAPEDGKSLSGTGSLLFPGLQQSIPVEIRTSDRIVPGFVGLDKELAGRLNVARHEKVEYDPMSGAFYSVDRRWRFFRAYARNIQQLEPLVAFLVESDRKNNLPALRPPISKISDVKHSLRLSSYMEQLYALIVAITGVSAFFAIAANVYAGIQRKKYDLAYLRLLGMGRGVVLFFPYLKNLVLVFGGMFLAWAFYLLFNHIASRLLFAGQGRLASIAAVDVLAVACGVWLVASVASLAASLVIYKNDPADSLRE